jgi:hypothetical protein
MGFVDCGMCPLTSTGCDGRCMHAQAASPRPFVWARRDSPKQEATLLQQLHNPERGLPHWSDAVDWRPGRWDPLDNAPSRGYPIAHVRGREPDGRVVEPMHYAQGDGDGMMPAFYGWFVPDGGSGFVGVHPTSWQPLRAAPRAPDGSWDE